MFYVHNPLHIPQAYLITFTTYGTWLHGDERGSIDPKHNQFGEEFLEADHLREKEEYHSLKHKPVYLLPEQRQFIDKSLAEICAERSWKLLEKNVRTNHLHIVLTAEEEPKKVMIYLKARCTLFLKRAGLFDYKRLWTKGGSTRYLWTMDAVESACRYVREQDKQHKR